MNERDREKGSTVKQQRHQMKKNAKKISNMPLNIAKDKQANQKKKQKNAARTIEKNERANERGRKRINKIAVI